MPVSAILQGENDLAPSEHLFGSSGGRRSYTLYQGHAGPVYSATFSPFGDFLLSSSSDSTSIIFSLFSCSNLNLYYLWLCCLNGLVWSTTVRLWSTKLNANLVCYKGHNYPVWDVQVETWKPLMLVKNTCFLVLSVL